LASSPGLDRHSKLVFFMDKMGIITLKKSSGAIYAASSMMITSAPVPRVVYKNRKC
jgi:hypothetical protein